ncbi:MULTISPECIES: hypothetical protein [Bacillales]|uniref:hypothetical protein n=1 Tax=Bacillales TaxID=1385 RepID=UPI0003466291|nr:MULTISPECIES: hypothetical protein [Bacillales]
MVTKDVVVGDDWLQVVSLVDVDWLGGVVQELVDEGLHSMAGILDSVSYNLVDS